MPAPYFRPGSGLFDDPMLVTLDHLGLTCVLGDVYVVDPALPWARLIQGLVKWSVRPGSIVILHDEGEEGGRGLRTAEVLRRLLPSLRSEGYRVVSVGELVAEATRTAESTRAKPNGSTGTQKGPRPADRGPFEPRDRSGLIPGTRP